MDLQFENKETPSHGRILWVLLLVRPWPNHKYQTTTNLQFLVAFRQF